MEIVNVEEIRKMKKTDLKELIENFVKSDERVCIIDEKNANIRSVRHFIYRKKYKYKIRVSKKDDKIILTKVMEYGSS